MFYIFRWEGNNTLLYRVHHSAHSAPQRTQDQSADFRSCSQS